MEELLKELEEAKAKIAEIEKRLKRNKKKKKVEDGNQNMEEDIGYYKLMVL